ncbi:MAG: DUF2345 domain-containing protein, partial [Cryobacterium sp.]|nr:DUF2345 domain-containing protein [Cryobacterium sp.]
LSLRAHTDELQIWADKEVTVISVNDEITVSAATKIELIAGQSSVTLEGSDIEFKTPGAFTAKGALKAFLGGGGEAAELNKLPDSKVKLFDEAFAVKDPRGNPMSALSYKITSTDGIDRSNSESDGKTIRVSTEASDKLKFELRWHDLEAKT